MVRCDERAKRALSEGKTFLFRFVCDALHLNIHTHKKRFIFHTCDDRDYPSPMYVTPVNVDSKCIHAIFCTENFNQICMGKDTMWCNFNEFIIAFGNGKVIFHHWSVFCCCFFFVHVSLCFAILVSDELNDDLRFDKKLMVVWTDWIRITKKEDILTYVFEYHRSIEHELPVILGRNIGNCVSKVI